MSKKIIGIVVCVLLIGSVLPVTGAIMYEKNAISTINDGTLSGYVKDTYMNPIDGALVQVYFHGTCEEDYTDSSGYYHVTNIPICYCLKNCTASKSGYKSECVLLSIVENTKYDFVLASGNTLYVGGSGPGNYSSIQDAINNASEGDTVFVYDDSSPYYENVVVDKSINLVGEDKVTTIIDGFKNDNVVNISANKVNVTGFTIQNGKGHHRSGLIIWSNFNTISDNTITLNYYGIDIQQDSCHNLVFENIIVYNENIGLASGWYSHYNTIKENIISSNGGIGIGLCHSKYNKIIGNIISQHYRGIKIRENVGCIITSNTIENNTLGLRLQFSRWSIIMKNNFVNNEEDAFFIKEIFEFENPIQYSLFLRNFWNESLSHPKIVRGEIWRPKKDYKWINFDWYPAQEPYDIGV